MLLSDTLFCSNARINLISVLQLMPKRRVNITFHPIVARIQTSGRIFLVNIYRRLYLFKLWFNLPCNNTAHVSYSIMDQIFQLWHEQMGHFRKQNIKRLQEMLINIARSKNAHLCMDCILGRIKEKPYNKPFPRWKYSFKYIYTDIASLFPIVGYNKCWYWVMFLDDATQLSTIIPIIYKSEIFAKFCKFLAKYK